MSLCFVIIGCFIATVNLCSNKKNCMLKTCVVSARCSDMDKNRITIMYMFIVLTQLFT